MIRAYRFYFLAIVLVLKAGLAQAQTQVQTGTPPFGSFGGGPDVINLANLNSHLTIPVLHKPGRGTNFNYDLNYDSSVWYPVTTGSTTAWQPALNWGWTSSNPTILGYVTYRTSSGNCRFFQELQWITEYYTFYSNWVYVDSLGTSHPLLGGIQDGGAPDCGPSATAILTTNDGSGYQLSVPDETLYTAAGAVVALTGGVFTDRNGNMIRQSGGVFTDTLGKTALTVSGTPPNPVNLTYTTSTGGAAFYQINYTNYTVATNFAVSGINEYKSAAAVPLVTSIVLPDGSQYTFGYESTPSLPTSGACTPYAGTTCVTARVTSVRLPTGGSITYAYSGGSGTNGSGIFNDGSAAILTRTTPDGTWTYKRTNGAGVSATLITAPKLPYDSASNQTIVQFGYIYETQRNVYQGTAPTFTTVPIPEATLQTAALLQETQTCYNASVLPCTGTPVILPIAQRTVIATLPGPGNLKSQHTDKFNSSGILTESDDYDLATAAPFPLLRQTLITLQTITVRGSAAAQVPKTVIVNNGSLVAQSRQDTAYDSAALTCRSGAANHDDSNYGCTFTTRGNPTSVTAYTNPVTPSGAITKNFTYDSLGNLITAQLNCCQSKTWNYSATTQYAYPDSVVSGSSAPQLTTSATYDLNMGLVLTATDANNIQSIFTYDNLGRPLTSKTGTNPAATYLYNDYNNSITFTPWTALECAPVQGTSTACQKTILDSQGRGVTTQVLDGGGTLYSATDVQYDVLGRSYKTSNPYTGSPTYWSQANFDALGRAIKSTLPDNSVSSIAYADNSATTTDPAGKKRKAVSDGLGRMTSVYEPDPANGNTLSLQTSYAYNVFDQLTQISQGSQTRTYLYDALGRLLSTTTPEAGSVCFGTLSGSTCQANGYDNFDNLLYRTDARGVVTNYLYDTLNRLVGVTYPTVPSGVAAMPNVCKANGSATNNANVCYVYGTSAASFNNGRIASMADTVGSESYTYDQYGNVTQLDKTIGTTIYSTRYAYNLANQLAQITYPSGRAIAQNLDTLGRLSSVVGTLNSVQTTYASGFSYNTAQQTSGWKYGNNLYASFGFSSDTLFLQCLDYSTTNRSSCGHDSTTKFGLNYAFPASPANNGQIASVADAVDTGRSATYTYDALYRLTSTLTTGSTAYPKWGLSETYDRYGNRSAQSISAGCVAPMTCPTNSVTIDVTKNRITGSPYAYDASGNMTNDGFNTLTYDGENRNTAAANGGSSGAYFYDGNGVRVKKTSVINSVSTTTVYLFSGPKVIAEYDNGVAAGSPSREYIFAGGRLLARLDSSGTRYYHEDHLSNRLVTDSNGNTVSQLGHFPYGENWYNASNDKLIFTSYARDAESGNDYAMARSYVNRLERFSSQDPLSGNIANPQSLDRYAYVLGDPIDLVDPFGMGSCDDSDPESCRCPVDTCIVVTAEGPGPELVLPAGSGNGRGGGGGGRGGGNGSGGFFSGILNRTKTVNRCAGQLSQAGSVTNLSGGRVPELAGSNTFGDIASLATGGGGLDHAAALGADFVAHAAPAIASQVAVGTMNSIGTAVSHTPGVYNPLTVGVHTARFGATTLGKIGIGVLEGVLTGKVLLDAGVYVGALVVCSEQ
jgi:RHS repeat-associated protein